MPLPAAASFFIAYQNLLFQNTLDDFVVFIQCCLNTVSYTHLMIHKESHRAGEGGAEAPGREAAECSARDTGPESYSLPLHVIGENSSHQIFFYVMGCVCSVRGGSHNPVSYTHLDVYKRQL